MLACAATLGGDCPVLGSVSSSIRLRSQWIHTKLHLVRLDFRFKEQFSAFFLQLRRLSSVSSSLRLRHVGLHVQLHLVAVTLSSAECFQGLVLDVIAPTRSYTWLAWAFE